MGLDVSAYSQAKKIDCHFNADGEPIDPKTGELIDGVQAFVNPDYPERADEIEDRAVYSVGDSAGMRAGSYGGYNQWREWLAELAGYEKGSYEQWGKTYDSFAATVWNGATGPFCELINFSDCEGIIGPKTSAKLLKDFEEHKDKAGGGYEGDKYREWMELFRLAANGGFVSFH